MRCAVLAVAPWAKMVLPLTPETKARARNSFPAEIGNFEPRGWIGGLCIMRYRASCAVRAGDGLIAKRGRKGEMTE